MQLAQRVWDWCWAVLMLPTFLIGYCLGRFAGSLIWSVRFGWQEAMTFGSQIGRPN